MYGSRIRRTDEIQRAHDILTRIVTGEIPLKMGDTERRCMIAQCDVLCWALSHDHNVEFSQLLMIIERTLEKAGIVFLPLHTDN